MNDLIYRFHLISVKIIITLLVKNKYIIQKIKKKIFNTKNIYKKLYI